MLKEPCSLLLHELGDHVAEDSADSIEALVGGANVVQSVVIEQDLLDDENCDSLAELRARLHNPQAKRDDLSREKKVDHLARVVLNKRADDSEGRQAKILERAGFRRGVEKRVEEKRNVGCGKVRSSSYTRRKSRVLTAEEQSAGVVMRRNTLEERKGIANAVGGGCGELGRAQQGIDADNLLKEGGHDT
jgi:hypothetical protein